MKIQYWGTAAAEGIPGLFCDCPVCQEAREKKGRYVRTRSQLLIDDAMLVDFNSDTYLHSLQYGYDLNDLKDVLITHVHSDHYYPEDFEMRGNGFAGVVKYPTLNIYGSDEVYETYKHATKGSCDALNQGKIAFHTIEKYVKYDISGYSVTPLPAVHGTIDPRVYIIEKDGKTVLILNDTGTPKEEFFDWLAKSKIKFDLVSWDCCAANNDTLKEWGPDASHMGFLNILDVKRRFEENGNCDEKTVNILTHFSHNGISAGYGDMKKIADDNGFIVAYDGMITEI